MFCGNCGEKLLSGAKFCGVCGEKTDAAPFVQEAAPQPPTAPSYPPQQSYAPQQGYVPPVPPAGAALGTAEDTTPMRMSDYLIMLLLMCIPIANIVLLFMWSFGASVNLNKKNLSRAFLIYAAAAMLLSLLFGAVFASIMGSFFSSFY